jgi:hypothetical protein
MKKKLATIVLFLIAALFPALGACYERAVETQSTPEAVAP